MTWGTFTPAHFASLGIGALIVLGLYFSLKKAHIRVQTAVLTALSLSGIAAIIYNLLAWDDPWQYLPLHLCSLNALVLPFAVLTRNKTLCNLLLVWSLGALSALVLNYPMAEATLWDWPFLFYYFPHLMEFAIPILLFRLGLVRKDAKCILSTIAISMAVYTLVHFINLAVIAFVGENVNYMFSITADNPFMALLYDMLPLRYWYMYLIVPILAVYLAGIYAPQLFRRKAYA